MISGSASPEQGVRAMDSCQERLATEHGLMLCDPPFIKTPCQEIRAVLFNPGMKENSGIFCHTQGWAVIAEAKLGRGDRAYAYYRAYMPSAYNDRADLREVEPYVHCQSTHGRYSRKFGKSRLPWLSGTATWSYIAGTQHILGIKPDWDGLRIESGHPEAVGRLRSDAAVPWRNLSHRREEPAACRTGRYPESSSTACRIDRAQVLPLAAAGSVVDVQVELG